jgi:beta-lactamase class C
VERALDLAERWVSDGRVPGVAACVVRSGGIVAERYAGVRDRRSGDPVQPDTLFALASLTKPLVASAVLVAVEEGLLDLDEEVRDGFALRHLLSHCSGLPEHSDELDAALLEPPATYRRYSNAGYALAGRLLQQAAEMPVPEYLHQAVLRPLGMDASLGLADEDAPRTATVREPGLLAPGEPLFNGPRFRAGAWCWSGGFASARGYAAFLVALLRGGQTADGTLLAQETVEEMLAPQFGELPGEVASVARWDACAWGLGFDVRGTREPHWAGDAVSASASTHFGASGALAWIDRERDLGLVALASRGTYSGWGMQPGGWADLSSAVAAAA